MTEMSVRLSVRPSVKRVNYDKTKKLLPSEADASAAVCTARELSHVTVAHDLQEKDKLVAELESKLTSLEDDLEQMKTTVEENDTELKVRRCHGNAMRGKHTCCYFN